MISGQTLRVCPEGKPVPTPPSKCGAGFFRIMPWNSKPSFRGARQRQPCGTVAAIPNEKLQINLVSASSPIHVQTSPASAETTLARAMLLCLTRKKLQISSP